MKDFFFAREQHVNKLVKKHSKGLKKILSLNLSQFS